jgi:hypothetical protein
MNEGPMNDSADRFQCDERTYFGLDRRMVGTVIAASVGILFSIVEHLSITNPHRSADVPILHWPLIKFLESTQGTLILSVAFTILCLVRIQRQGAWVYALLAGAGFGHVFLQMLKPA